MSLFRQIQILVTTLLLITLIIVLRINFNTAQEFTANQSYLNAKNHANILALSLSSNPSDEALIKTSINAMFDGGYFESIALVRQDGSMVYKKQEAVVVHDVPPFFINYIDLILPVAEARVMDGWNIFGTLKIKGHPGPSYKKLWVTLKQLCLQFLLLGIAVFFVSFLGLRHLLSALEKIKHQAEEISNNEFIINQDIPKTPELKKVVLAMNAMVKKVQSIYDRHLENLTQYQQLRDKDKITGLYNRSSFVKLLGDYIKSSKEKANGHIIILGLTGIEQIELSGDRPLVNRIFKYMARTVEKETESIKNALAARFPRREFAVILPDTGSKQVFAFVKTIIHNFMSESGIEIIETIGVYGGISAYNDKDDVRIILSKADYALSKARIGLKGTIIKFNDEQSQAALGKQEWKKLIENACSNNRFFLTAQPVMSRTGEFHREVFIKMIDHQGVQYRAGLFMPMILTLGLESLLDQYILKESDRYLLEHPKDILAINITTEFCRDRLAGPWLRKFLMNRKSLQGQLIFEIHENTLINYTEICIDFVGLITGLGFRFGIDQFTMHDTSLNLLKKIKPYYIKVERDYLEAFDDPEKADMVLNSLFTITESLNIKLIATKIENKVQQMELADKNITHFQGHGIAKIAPLKDEHE